MAEDRTSSRVDMWMPFFIGDYIADTMHLSATDHGIYLLLIFAYWRNGGPLRDDPLELAAIAKRSQTEWQTDSVRIGRFFQIGDGVWRHKRIDAEIAKAEARVSARKKASAAGNNARWGNSEDPKRTPSGIPNGVPNGVPAESQNCPSSPSPSHVLRERERAREDVPVELPRGFPKTADEAASHAGFCGCTEDFARQVWHESACRGGTDISGQPVRMWRHYLSGRMASKASKAEERRGSARPPHQAEANQRDEQVINVPMSLEEADRRKAERDRKYGRKA